MALHYDRKYVWPTLGALFGPPIVLSLYVLLCIVLKHHAVDPTVHWMVFGFSIAVGAISICLFPGDPLTRSVFAVLYTPVAAAIMWHYPLVFYCAVTGDCL